MICTSTNARKNTHTKQPAATGVLFFFPRRDFLLCPDWKVGLFRFCRALDSATDWVAFVEPTPAGSGGGRKHNAPVSWALSGGVRFLLPFFFNLTRFDFDLMK